MSLRLHPLRVQAVTAAILSSLCAAAHASTSGLVISQVYGGGGATSGSPSYRNDFVELFNAGSTPLSLNGLSLQYASATGVFGSSNVMGLSGTVAPGGYYLVQLGGGSVGGVLPLTPDDTGSLNLSATAGKVALVQGTAHLNCGSSASVCSPAQRANIIDLVAYGSTSMSEGAPASALNNTTTAVRLNGGCTDTDNNSSDLQAITPAPAPRNSSSPLNTACGAPAPAPAPAPSITPIGAIQGSGHTSPLVGTTVTTEGVVTLVSHNGFFMQSRTPDALSDTSDGILVFTSTAPTVNAGDEVRVTATVTEYKPGTASSTLTVTELSAVSALTTLSTGHTVQPTPITFPEVTDGDLEKVEGMLVRIDTELTASQNYFLGRYGQITLSAQGRLFKPTHLHLPGSTAAQALAEDNARRRLILDDGKSLQNPDPTPYLAADHTQRAGDTLPGITGVIDYGLATASAAGLADYKIHPTVPVSFTRANPRTATPDTLSGTHRVASFNVLNYFNGDGLGGGFPTSRGADTAAEFARQRAKIMGAIAALNADVVGLMEIENDGEGTQSAIADLVRGLNTALGGPVYAIVPAPATAGSTGTDEIKVAMIYRPARLSLSGGSQTDTSAIHNRPPMAQTFAAANGERFTVVVNHFKSKGCDASSPAADADQGDGQGCFNHRREQQAEALHSFIQGIQSTQGDSDVLIIGDLNAYGQEDPIVRLSGLGYVDLLASSQGTPSYSYVFDGEAGYLDHALASASFTPQITRALHWHINADEPSVIDYNTEFKVTDHYTSSPYRSSDHDPVVLGLSLFKPIVGSARGDVIQGSAGDDRITGGYGADVITTDAGQDVLVYTSTRDGIDRVTDFTPGSDRIDLSALLSPVGVIDPIASGHVRLVDTAAGVQIRVDLDGSAGAASAIPLLTLSGRTAAQIVVARDLILSLP